MTYDFSGNLKDNSGNRRTTIPFDLASGSASVRVTQPLPKNSWIDQTRWNIKVAKTQVEYTELGLKQTIMSLITTVEQNDYDLLDARENVVVQEKAVELATQLVVENKKRVEVGALAPWTRTSGVSGCFDPGGFDRRQDWSAVQQNNLKQLLTDDYAALTPVDLQPAAPLRAQVHVFDRQISWSKGLNPAARPAPGQARYRAAGRHPQVHL